MAADRYPGSSSSPALERRFQALRAELQRELAKASRSMSAETRRTVVAQLSSDGVSAALDAHIASLAAVAFSGDYDDLINKPTTVVHEQITPSAEWSITHDLDRFPSVTIVDSSKREVLGEIVYESESEITIKFTAAFSGYAYLN